MYDAQFSQRILKRILNIRGHPVSKKKTGKARPAIVRFLRFPERELGSGRAREPEGDSDQVKSSQVN